MSKLQYASVLAVFATIMIVLIVFIGRDKEERYINIKKQIYLIFVMDIIYFVSFFSNNQKWLTVNHCIVQIFELLCAYMFFAFVVKYSDERIKDCKILRRIMAWSVALL